MADLLQPVFGAAVVYIACLALMVGGATQLVTCFMPWPGSGALRQIKQEDDAYWNRRRRHHQRQ